MDRLPDLAEPLMRVGAGMAAALRGLAEAMRATAPMAPAEVAARVEALLEAMLAARLKADLPLNHFVTGQLYARELLIPAGTFAIGEIQKYGHINVVSRGEISMLDATGGVTRVQAPFTSVGMPGVRKCGYAHEDTVWTTVHDMSAAGWPRLEDVPIGQLEEHLVVRNREAWIAFQNEQRRGANP